MDINKISRGNRFFRVNFLRRLFIPPPVTTPLLNILDFALKAIYNRYF